MDRPGGLDELDGKDELGGQVNLHGLEEPDRPDGLEELTDQTGSTSWTDRTDLTSWTALRSCLKKGAGRIGAGRTGRTRQGGRAFDKLVLGQSTWAKVKMNVPCSKAGANYLTVNQMTTQR